MDEQQDAIQVFMEYKILEGYERQYQNWMKRIETEMNQLGVKHFRWLEALEQPGLYVEWFTVSSIEVYEAVKSARRTREDPRFGDLAQWISKPLEQVNCWAFRDLT
ncbi:hypothetical protein HNR44_002627 [Geomicrobium halophilum]|uniref:NIPSNAP protein n=1 Tax=Geomicrobium halophilum TaxID=549000 RepID=A0A841PP81_9BACL|nr:hypothetical protein [Geomicrobium halophilum]MBB6450637.1 hypothetical protein [Geomicrobium halophilum]